MWPKQHGGIGQNSGAFPALACPGTSRSWNDIWPARRHLSSAPVSVGRRIANMVARVRDQMWKEVLDYALRNTSHLYQNIREVAVVSYCRQLCTQVLVICW